MYNIANTHTHMHTYTHTHKQTNKQTHTHTHIRGVILKNYISIFLGIFSIIIIRRFRHRPKLFTLWLDSRFPHRQTTSGESQPVHLQLHHTEHRSPTGLCPEPPALLSLHTHDRVSSHSSTSIVKFADDTVVLGLISNNDETAYLDEVERLTSWCQDNCLSLRD